MADESRRWVVPRQFEVIRFVSVTSTKEVGLYLEVLLDKKHFFLLVLKSTYNIVRILHYMKEGTEN